MNASQSGRHVRDGPIKPHWYPVLVLGIGNILLRDEGVGVRVIEAMLGLDLPAGVELADGGTAGLGLLDVISGRRKVVVVDALDIGGEPGAVLRLRPDDLVSRGPGHFALHEVGLLDALEMAARLDSAPGETVILGVTPKDVSWGTELSPEVARAVPGIVRLVLAELR